MSFTGVGGFLLSHLQGAPENTCALESDLSETGAGAHEFSLSLLLVCLRGLMSLLEVLASGSTVRPPLCRRNPGGRYNIVYLCSDVKRQ